MIYKKPTTLLDLIVFALIESDAEYLTTVKAHELPETFQANFWLKDKGKAWRVKLWVRIENEIPLLFKVETFGAGEIPLLFLQEMKARLNDKSRPWRDFEPEDLNDSFQPIQARHISVVAKFHRELLGKAVTLAIEGQVKKSNRVYLMSELVVVEKELAKGFPRNAVTDSMLRDIARRYLKAEKAGEPLYEDIMRKYSISERRVRELVTMCRRHPEKLLPKKKAGRPSVDQTPTRKKGK
jgi:hypothetical protein